MVTQDLVKVAMAGALRALNDAVEEHGWDQPPALWVVRRNLDETGFALFFDAILQGGPLSEGHPSDVLSQMADFAESKQPDLGSNIFAYVFVSEAWMVQSGDEDVLTDALARGLHRRADRVEVRMTSAVDLAGFHYAHSYVRETGERTESASRRGEDPNFVSGYVYESLQRMLNATV